MEWDNLESEEIWDMWFGAVSDFVVGQRADPHTLRWVIHSIQTTFAQFPEPIHEWCVEQGIEYEIAWYLTPHPETYSVSAIADFKFRRDRDHVLFKLRWQ